MRQTLARRMMTNVSRPQETAGWKCMQHADDQGSGDEIFQSFMPAAKAKMTKCTCGPEDRVGQARASDSCLPCVLVVQGATRIQLHNGDVLFASLCSTVLLS